MSEVYSSAEKLEFFRRIFGGIDITNKGNIQVRCPRCAEQHADLGMPLHKRKLAISISKSDVFHCWTCGYKGHITKVLRTYAKSGLREYIKRFGDPHYFVTAEDTGTPIKRNVELPMDFKLLCTNMKSDDYFINRAISYLKGRGLTERDFWYYKIGISDAWPWKWRVIFPSFDSLGSLNYLVGRAYRDNMRFDYWDSAFDKNEIIFNELNIDWTRELTITEGVFDLVKCNDNAVPLLGSTLSDKSLLYGMILKHETPICLALDADTSGTKKLSDMFDLLLSSGVRVRKIDVKDDVGEMTKEQFILEKENAKQIDRLAAMIDKVSLMRMRGKVF